MDSDRFSKRTADHCGWSQDCPIPTYRGCIERRDSAVEAELALCQVWSDGAHLV